MTDTASYTAGDLANDLRHMSDVIDILADLTAERDERFYPEKTDSLLYLVREEAERLVERIKAVQL